MQSVLVRPIQRRLTDHSRPILYHGFAGGASSQLIDFSRNSTVNGWTLDANGDPVLTEFAIDDPAVVVDPATGRSLGYRALEGFTNSLLWNRDLSQGGWGGAASVEKNAVGLDGVANTAWTVTEESDTSISSIRQDITVADDSQTHRAAFYIKKDNDESRFPECRADFSSGETSLNYRAQINTKTGEKAARLNASLSDITVYDLGIWWLVVIEAANNSTGNTNFRQGIHPAISETLGSADQTTTGSIVYDFGGVYLNSEIAGPPIETQAEPVSTAPDNATEVLPESCRDGFVWVIRARMPTSDDDLRFIGDFRDTHGGDRISAYFRSVNKIRLLNSADGFNVRDFPIAAGADAVFVVSVTPTETRASMNGGEVQKILTGMPPIDMKETGHRATAGRHLNSTIYSDELYPNPQDWTDADLQEASKL